MMLSRRDVHRCTYALSVKVGRVRLMAVVASAVVLVPLAGGCSTTSGLPSAVTSTVSPSGVPQRPVDSSGFWEFFQAGALEADPPQSLAELTNRSTLIVTGTVASVGIGPLEKSEDGNENTTQLLALVVRGESVLKGDLTEKSFKVAIMSSGPPELVVAEAKPSGNQTLFFLVPRRDGYFACAALAGLVEDTPEGLVTVADPGQSSVVTGVDDTKITTFDGLVSEVQALVKQPK